MATSNLAVPVGGDATQARIERAWKLALPEVLRIFGGSMLLLRIARGELEPVFLAPAGLAVLIGMTAPLVVWGIRRGGLTAWGMAVAWNAVALVDFAVGWTEILVVRPAFLSAMPFVLMPAVVGPLFFALHIWCLRLLLRSDVRAAFARRERLG